MNLKQFPFFRVEVAQCTTRMIARRIDFWQQANCSTPRHTIAAAIKAPVTLINTTSSWDFKLFFSLALAIVRLALVPARTSRDSRQDSIARLKNSTTQHSKHQNCHQPILFTFTKFQARGLLRFACLQRAAACRMLTGLSFFFACWSFPVPCMNVATRDPGVWRSQRAHLEDAPHFCSYISSPRMYSCQYGLSSSLYHTGDVATRDTGD
jgi:hypothetical protein